MIGLKATGSRTDVTVPSHRTQGLTCLLQQAPQLQPLGSELDRQFSHHTRQDSIVHEEHYVGAGDA